jgi:hypothetical protein
MSHCDDFGSSDECGHCEICHAAEYVWSDSCATECPYPHVPVMTEPECGGWAQRLSRPYLGEKRKNKMARLPYCWSGSLLKLNFNPNADTLKCSPHGPGESKMLCVLP